jgi:hypothetical protein
MNERMADQSARCRMRGCASGMAITHTMRPCRMREIGSL